MSPPTAPSLDEATDAALLASRALVGVAAVSLADAESSVTIRQYRALVLVGNAGELNLGTLAEGLGIHPSTATRLCDRLHAKDLIEREVSAGNRREVAIRLTAEGERLVRTVMVQRRRALRRILGRLEPAQLQALVDAFDAFADAAGETPDAAWMLGWTD